MYTIDFDPKLKKTLIKWKKEIQSNSFQEAYKDSTGYSGRSTPWNRPSGTFDKRE